jgi:CO/xanthine dehydrogenase FAD-binding subunit
LTVCSDSAKIADMRVALPTTLDDAVDALAAQPEAQLLAGGTDFCVEVNFAARRPEAVVALRRVSELRTFEVTATGVTIGAGTTYTDMEDPALAAALPALAAAARTIGSPQIRNAGTLGGNLATASPAGDTLPLLVAMDAVVRLRGRDGERTLALAELVTGVKRTAIAPGEVIVDVALERRPGAQQFLKVGTRNAMVIAIASAAVVLDVAARRVRVGLGSVAPVPLRATAAENHASEEIDWPTLQMSDSALVRFGRLAAEASSPITDHRSSAEYRRRAVEVITRRGLERCLRDAA